MRSMKLSFFGMTEALSFLNLLAVFIWDLNIFLAGEREPSFALWIILESELSESVVVGEMGWVRCLLSVIWCFLKVFTILFASLRFMIFLEFEGCGRVMMFMRCFGFWRM